MVTVTVRGPYPTYYSSINIQNRDLFCWSSIQLYRLSALSPPTLPRTTRARPTTATRADTQEITLQGLNSCWKSCLVRDMDINQIAKHLRKWVGFLSFLIDSHVFFHDFYGFPYHYDQFLEPMKMAFPPIRTSYQPSPALLLGEGWSSIGDVMIPKKGRYLRPKHAILRL